MMTLEELVREARTLPLQERKRLIGLLVDTLTEHEPGPAPAKRSILDYEGVGAEMWQGIDAQEFVNQLRSEWDTHP